MNTSETSELVTRAEAWIAREEEPHVRIIRTAGWYDDEIFGQTMRVLEANEAGSGNHWSSTDDLF